MTKFDVKLTNLTERELRLISDALHERSAAFTRMARIEALGMTALSRQHDEAGNFLAALATSLTGLADSEHVVDAELKCGIVR